MSITRREALLFLASGLGAVALGTGKAAVAKTTPLKFTPVRGVMPLPTDGLTGAQQKTAYRQVEVRDDLVLPEGYTYEVIASWGDPLGDSRFGYNNDYLSFIPAGANQGYLTVNFEYISALPWTQTYQQVIGEALPFEELQKALEKGAVDAYGLPAGDPLKEQIQKVAVAALTDVGIGVMTIRQEGNRWVKAPSPADRRISGISGWRDGNYLDSTGPATLIFRKTQGQGYVDNLGTKIIGTLGNCAGGTTPWGTVLSAEENFQYLVAEPVYSDGTSFAPATRPFAIADGELAGHGSALGLPGNKYGWIVEIDPANPNDRGTKHTWLGRYRHEAVGIRVVAGKPLAFYSGCDRRGGHLYKFVSREAVQNPQDKNNSRLLRDGMLYAAKFNPDGTGRWIPLQPETPVNPDPPEVHAGGLLNLPKRPEGGFAPVTKTSEVEQYKQQYKTLGDLYTGSREEKQGAILIDAHYAANAVGATCTARPEDTEVAADGTLYIAFTSGSPSSKDGGPDERVFIGPYNQKSYEPGWIMALREQGGEPTAMTFTWQMVATGGEPTLDGGGFANPDNLMVDSAGDLWMVTDMSTSRLNNPAAVPGIGRFGNNTMWYIPTQGAQAGQAFLFAIGPMGCEMTGPYLSDDRKTLFLAVQHPGEDAGIRKDGAKRTLEVRMQTKDGERFMQERVVPQGSNWPARTPNAPPKPAVVAIRRLDGQPLA
jgi:secreted PhoX family phosphatase